MTIMKKYIVFAASALALAGCSSDEYLGNEPGQPMPPTNVGITFGSKAGALTRADIVGSAAADILGRNFIVEGTKGVLPATSTTTTPVFDNYLVVFGENTAATTESNTDNWEYVGVSSSAHMATAVLNGSDFGRDVDQQTIKYWDYSVPQYDFVAYSTGDKEMIATGDPTATQVKVTKINGTSKAYTFEATSADALSSVYVTDVVTVEKANYGNPVMMKFKNLTSKIRMAIYETVPGYSVRDVEFFASDAASFVTVAAGDVTKKAVFAVDAYDDTQTLVHSAGEDFVAGTWYESDGTTPIASPSKEILTSSYFNSDGTVVYAEGTDYDGGTTYYGLEAEDEATLYTAAGTPLPTTGTIAVTYPYTGTSNSSNESYNKAQVSVTAGAGAGATSTTQSFDALADGKKVAAEHKEKTTGNVWIGRQSNLATFAGDAAANYYQAVMPNNAGTTLTLRVNYTLESTDGSGEVIKVWGAKAIVPATYTKWQPNYAYTYLFKISDKSNGSTEKLNGVENLFPITFDAVVAEVVDATAEQTTITTVATPSITTYQKAHVYTVDNEYSAGDGDIYVMVSKDDASLATDLATKGQLYTVSTTGAAISEATVADALIKQTSATGDPATITGRNKVVLTPATSVADITAIPGVDGNDMTVVAGTAAKFTPAAGTYAYVYDATTGAKTVIDQFQPIVTEKDVTDVENLYSLAWSSIDDPANQLAADEAADDDYIYFAVTTNGSVQKTYSYITTKAGQTISKGMYKVAKSSLTKVTTSGAKAAESTFYFDTYKENNGVYGVKIIKVIA